MRRQILGTKPKVPRVTCAYCGKSISARCAAEPPTPREWHTAPHTYTGKYYRRGYGIGDEVRFCNLSTCALYFAIAAFRAGLRMKVQR